MMKTKLGFLCKIFFVLNCFLLHSQILFASYSITLMGAPGSGKGTVGEMISQKYNIPRISTGDIVRAEIQAQTEFGKMVQTISSSGGLIQDGTSPANQLLEKLKDRLSQEDCKNGFILDGYPRSALQAKQLDEILAPLGKKIIAAPFLEVSRETLLDRTAGRIICKNCSLSYHEKLRPPTKPMTCDRCCQLLTIRADDKREVVEKRLDLFEKEIEPLKAFYKSSGRLKEIDGEGEADSVAEKLFSKLESKNFSDRNFLQEIISSYPGPKAEIPRMYNIVEIYENPALFSNIVERFSEVISTLSPDYLAAPEARAWPLLGALAFTNKIPALSIRKAGKLPKAAPKNTVTYETAYSKDSIEMILNESHKGKTVVLIDDGISSGGTTLAAINLLQAAGMRVLRVMAMIEYHYGKKVEAFRVWDSATMTLYDLY